MTITMKNGELEEAYAKLNEALKSDVSLPAKANYKIIKNSIAMRNALEPYNSARQDIVNKHSNGKGTISEKENPAEFDVVYKAISEIASESVTFEITEMNIGELGDKEYPLCLFSAIDFMISE